MQNSLNMKTDQPTLIEVIPFAEVRRVIAVAARIQIAGIRFEPLIYGGIPRLHCRLDAPREQKIKSHLDWVVRMRELFDVDLPDTFIMELGNTYVLLSTTKLTAAQQQ